MSRRRDFPLFRGFFLQGRRPRSSSPRSRATRPISPRFSRRSSHAFRRRGADAARGARPRLAEASLTVVEAVRADYAAAKRRRGALDYDDLIVVTLRLLDKADAAAWVLFKLDGGIDHVLIDEAQDTSPEQWAIVGKLTEEFFAGEARGPRAHDLRRRRREAVDLQFPGRRAGAVRRQPPAFRATAPRGGTGFRRPAAAASRRSAPHILCFRRRRCSPRQARRGLTSREGPISHEALRLEARAVSNSGRRWSRRREPRGRSLGGRSMPRPDSPVAVWPAPWPTTSAAGSMGRRACRAHAAPISARRHHDPVAAARTLRQRDHPPAQIAAASPWPAPTASRSPTRSPRWT